ncbi:hypothetical protein IAT40_007437 [Kwoniella sp. CBS 6097]
MLTPPLFCSICSAPCLLPRLALRKNPRIISHSHSHFPETGHSPSHAHEYENEHDYEYDYDSNDWLSAWYCLRVSSGIVDPAPFLFHHLGEPPIQIPLSSRSRPRSSSEVQAVQEDKTRPKEKDHRRCVTIHAYCLSAIKSMIRQSAFSSSSPSSPSSSVGGGGARTHEESFMLSWSLPRWTGHGPWVNKDMRDLTAWIWNDRGTRSGYGVDAARGDGWSMSIGFWGGTASQRERWKRTGDHLNDDDLVSPLMIGQLMAPPPVIGVDGSSDRPDQPKRPEQKSLLTKLPSSILIRICQYTLDDPIRPCTPFIIPIPSTSPTSTSTIIKPGSSQNKPISTTATGTGTGITIESTVDLTPLLNPKSIQSFFNLLQTCSATRELDLPSWIWHLLTLDSVRKYRGDLLKRWRANPSGVGSAALLWSALDEAFYHPVLCTIQQVHHAQAQAQADAEQGDNDDGDGGAVEGARRGIAEQKVAGARDVWYWWNYDRGWKSRRRVWWCVVQGCATARDADWW